MSVLDPIATFMGSIPADEHEQRRRIFVARNCGSYKATSTGNAIARVLAWLVVDIANAHVFAPDPIDVLTEVAELLRILLDCADRAEIAGARG